MEHYRLSLFERLGNRWKWWSLGFAALLVLVTVVDVCAVAWRKTPIPEPLGYILVAWLAMAVILVTVAGAAVWVHKRGRHERAAVAEHLAFVIAEMGLMRRILEQQRPAGARERAGWDGGGLNHRIVVPPRSATVYGARQDVGSKDFLPETMEGIGFDDDTGSLALGSS